MARRACLVIGVGTVAPLKNQAMRFGYLDGAVIAARTIGEWALRSGFGADNVRIVEDEQVDGKDNLVTCKRVQQAVDELFPQGADVVEQLILAFCGHGLTDMNIGSISWLFSDSQLLKYRILADAFYTELLLHGIQRITLITDACREAPKELDLMRFEAVRGIVVQGAQVENPKFDRFAACQDGQLGYMVSEGPGKPGKCIFSGVIADVLWGIEPAAIDNGVITTNSFGKCVRSRTTERAKDYRLKLNPQCSVDPEAAVLYDAAKPPPGPPGLQPWPPPGAAAVMGTAIPAADAGDADRNLELVHSDESFRKRVLGPSFGLNRIDGASLESLRIPDGSKDLLQDLVTLRIPSSTRTLETRVPGKRRKVKALIDRLESDVAADARKRAAGQVRRSVTQIKPSAGPDGSNLIVSGDDRARLWSRGPVQRRKQTSARIGFRVESDPPGTPVLVELASGSFMPIVPYEGFYTVVTQSQEGNAFQAYGRHDSRDAFRDALKVIADFAAGLIGPDNIKELVGLLSNKHADPVLGTISAYLYRTLADFDSIRRMAFFYFDRGQPVPFDIALLGGMGVTREANGALLLHVPAVKVRKHQDGEPDLPEFVTAATPAAQAMIGGRCPWLGLGWDYVGLARPEWAALVDGLADHGREVRRSGFTVLPNKTGLALANSWELQAR
jgi:hypothetical protein